MSDDELTISAAVQRFEVSRKTIRRRLAEGAIEGARQRPGDHGPEWVFPAASVEALGYRPRDGADGAAQEAQEAREDGAARASGPAEESPDAAAVDPAPAVGAASGATIAETPSAPVTTADPAVSLDDAGLPGPDDGASAGRRPRRVVAIALLLLVGPIIGFLLAGLVGDDDDAEPLGALLAAVTSDGDEIGVLGAPPDARLPEGRVPVPVSDTDVADGQALPRYVVAGGDAAPDTVRALQSSARTVLSLDRPTGAVWVFDTGAVPEAAPTTVAASSSSTDAPPSSAPQTAGPPAPTTEAPPTTTPATTAPPTTTLTTAAPPTTAPAANPGPEVEGPSPSDPGDPEGGADQPAPGTADTRTVADGDHFWSIAEDVVADALGTTPTDAQVTAYWAQLLDANADILVEPGNFDLLVPGQVLELPPAA